MPEANWVALELAARGIPVLSVDYVKCLGDVHFPEPTDEVRAAWHHARGACRGALRGRRRSAVLLGGASAGGNLTAGAVAQLQDAGDPVPAGLILVYPVVHPNGPDASAEVDLASPHGQLACNFAGSEEALRDPHAFAAPRAGGRIPVDARRRLREGRPASFGRGVRASARGCRHRGRTAPRAGCRPRSHQRAVGSDGAADHRGDRRVDRTGRRMSTFTNPILAGDRPDPAIIKVGDEYWMTYSSFEAAPGLLLYRSTRPRELDVRGRGACRSRSATRSPSTSPSTTVASSSTSRSSRRRGRR